MPKYGKRGTVGPAGRFTWDEFACSDGTQVPHGLRDDAVALAVNLNKMRRVIAKHYKVRDDKVLININSAYRSPKYNSKIGGARNSQHVYARAADIRVYVNGKRLGVQAVHSFALQVKEFRRGGLGTYDKKHGDFNHVDIRGKYGMPPARWHNKG